jgi:Glycosyl transferases group 1
VGEGWWEDQLRAAAAALGISDCVDFHGYVDERTKHELLARSWVHLCPSVKEGWGLVVSEAGGQQVPTVGYRSAGGLRESVLEGRTGLLVDDLDGFTEAVDGLLRDDAARTAMGRAASEYTASLTWPASVSAFADVLESAAGGSAARAVVQDVDDRLGPLRGGMVGIGDDREGRDRGDAQGAASAHGDQDGDEGLHSGTLLRGGRRSVTVEGNVVIHNNAVTTTSSAHA